ncbi:hypothetical protein [Bacillus velezensis]|uniref:hypothetical protein n=1 Tax=Bacillus velezensis TaxID=492670 RepID=UPI003D7F8164
MKSKKNATLSIGFKEKQQSSRKSIDKKPQKLTERLGESHGCKQGLHIKEAVVEPLDSNNNGREMLWIKKIKTTMKIK